MNAMKSLLRSRDDGGREPSAHPVAPVQAMPHSLLQLQRAAGNHAASSLLRPDTSADFESEAAAAARHVLSKGLLGQTGMGLKAGRLDTPSRRVLEAQFGTDLGGLRFHTGQDADRENRRAGTNAMTVGEDVYLRSNRSNPATPEAMHTVVHEVAHAVQQRGGTRSGGIDSPSLSAAPVGVQGEPDTQAPAPITARSIIPFPAGSRVVLNRILPDMWFRLLESAQPDVANAARAIDRLTMTVNTATDDLVEAASSAPVTVPAQGKTPAKTYNPVTLRVSRNQDGTFNFVVTGVEAGGATETLFSLTSLNARRDGAAVILEEGTGANAVPQLRLSSSNDQLRAEAYTAPYLSEIPESLRGLAPERIDLLQLTQLPSAPAGSQAEQQAVESIASRVSSRRSLPTQRLGAGAGVAFAPGVSPLLNVSWQMTFRPSRVASGFFQVPLEVQLLYVPPLSGLVGVGTAADLSLAPLEIPVNVRINAGLAGGALYGQPSVPGAPPELRGAFGPTVGGAAGLEFNTFRINLRYDHLFNLINNSPNADTLLLRFEKAF